MDNLKCVKCQKYLQVPIFICKKTKASTTPHMQCGQCCLNNEQTSVLQECYNCRGELERNQLIEKVILQATYPCIYEKNGCKFSLRIDKKADHENNECFYRALKCSTEGKRFSKQWECDWTDNVENFYDHFRDKHADNVYKYTSDKNELKIPLNFSKQSQTIHLFSAHFRLFWLNHQFSPEKQKAYWTIQYFGPKNKASNYYYEFEFLKADDSIRKYKITEYCESHLMDPTIIFSSGKCVAISFDTLMSFMTNGEITFRFRVCKIDKTKEQSAKPTGRSTTTSNLQNNNKNMNVGDIIGSSPIAANLPPLNLPTVSRGPRSKSVVHARRRR